MADLTTEQIDRLWHRMGSFYPNDHREFARAVLAEAARQAEQERVGRESTAFGEWWDANQQDPLHTMIVRNAAAAAWQERARRALGVKTCRGGPGECSHNGACMYACGGAVPCRFCNGSGKVAGEVCGGCMGTGEDAAAAGVSGNDHQTLCPPPTDGDS